MKFIPQSVTRFVGKQILNTKINSPHIFFVGGIAAVLGGTFLACRSTLRLEEELDHIKHDVDVLQTLKNDVGVIKDNHTYTEHDYCKDMGYIYSKSAVSLCKLYGPALLVGGAGIAALTGSHLQLTRRNTALTVTLAAVSQAYDEYRKRVREEFGDTREMELHRAIRTEEHEINGKKQKVKITDPSGWSPYARFFDETSQNWVKNAEINRIFLECQQNYMNDLLQARGHVFLNEVYDALGLERSRAGIVVGWVLDGDGDGYIDFGIFEAHNSWFVNNIEPRIMLDFNVDGTIFNKIKE